MEIFSFFQIVQIYLSVYPHQAKAIKRPIAPEPIEVKTKVISLERNTSLSLSLGVGRP